MNSFPLSHGLDGCFLSPSWHFLGRDRLGGCGDSFPESGQFHGRTAFDSFEEGVSEVLFESVELDRQGRVVDAEVSGCFGEGGVGLGRQER